MTGPTFRAIRDPRWPDRWTIIGPDGQVQCRLGAGEPLAPAAQAIAEQTGGRLIVPPREAHGAPPG